MPLRGVVSCDARVLCRVVRVVPSRVMRVCCVCPLSVSREPYVFLQFITDCWDNMPSVVIFTQVKLTRGGLALGGVGTYFRVGWEYLMHRRSLLYTAGPLHRMIATK